MTASLKDSSTAEHHSVPYHLRKYFRLVAPLLFEVHRLPSWHHNFYSSSQKCPMIQSRCLDTAQFLRQAYQIGDSERACSSQQCHLPFPKQNKHYVNLPMQHTEIFKKSYDRHLKCAETIQLPYGLRAILSENVEESQSKKSKA